MKMMTAVLLMLLGLWALSVKDATGQDVTSQNAATGGLDNGTLLVYQGTMLADKGLAALTRKEIELSVLVSELDDNGATLWWTLDQQGRGDWPWPDRFGRLRLNARYKPVGVGVPALLYQRDGGNSLVPLDVPLLLGPEPLAQGLVWNDGRNTLSVTGQAHKADHPTWRVESTTPYGRNRTIWVDRHSPLVVSLKRKIFIGQGEKHELKLQLTSRKRLDPQQFAAALDGYAAFVKLRQQLGYELRSAAVQWSDQQLATLRAELAGASSLAESGPLAAVARAAREDARDQKDRSGAVAALRRRAIGRRLVDLKLESLSGGSWTAEDLMGEVTLLHLWEYQDKPLEEPYGQVGYLDFLYRQRKADGLKVIGVVVDRRLADPATRQQAVSGARKLKSFMNLSYPLLLDYSSPANSSPANSSPANSSPANSSPANSSPASGAMIEMLGDPRVTGAKLPLYVLVGREGSVIQYHSGLYQVNRDRGLEQLDELIRRALDSRE